MMFTRAVSTITLALGMTLSAPTGAGPVGAPAHPPGRPALATLTYGTPTAVEAADMTFMREEEKLARDVYLTLFDEWGLAPFANIATSEQRHMDAMLRLLRSYGLPDPAAGNTVGEFTDPLLQGLFDTLIAKGMVNAVEGLKVGGLIEEVDMRDIQAAIDRSAQADIDAVYANLMCGSRNHLRAFAGALEGLTGTPYAAQLLDAAVVNAILAAPMERCGGH
jgi:hypothetical protein